MSKTHDYSVPGWGHAVSVLSVEKDGQEIRVSGFGHGVTRGDYLILPDGEGGTTRYRVMRIRRMIDPADMWFADLTFSPRQNGASDE